MSLTIEQLSDLTVCERCGAYHSQARNCPVCELQLTLQKILDSHKKQLEHLSAVIRDRLEEEVIE